MKITSDCETNRKVSPKSTCTLIMKQDDLQTDKSE